MILLCELTFLNRTHVPFNAGLLATIRAAFPQEDLAFWGEAVHVEELKKEVGPTVANSISWKHICPPAKGTGYVRRVMCELDILQSALSSMADDRVSRLVLTSAQPSTVLALKVVRWSRSSRTPAQMILHGLSGVVGKRYRRPIRRFQDMKTALTLLGNTGIQYLVLEKVICETVIRNLPSMAGNIEALEHPITPHESTPQAVDLREPIQFGFLGLANKAKGFPLFVRTAGEVKAVYGPKADFHAIGHTNEGNLAIDGTDALATRPVRTKISREDFIRSVSQLHFVVLPHEAEQYTLAASGVLLDAINWGKPIIARKIPIFEAMFDRYGDIGYLFTDDAELKKNVEEIVRSPDDSRYNRQVGNLRTAKASRVPETLASAYRDICAKNSAT